RVGNVAFGLRMAQTLQHRTSCWSLTVPLRPHPGGAGAVRCRAIPTRPASACRLPPDASRRRPGARLHRRKGPRMSTTTTRAGAGLAIALSLAAFTWPAGGGGDAPDAGQAVHAAAAGEPTGIRPVEE